MQASILLSEEKSIKAHFWLRNIIIPIQNLCIILKILVFILTEKGSYWRILIREEWHDLTYILTEYLAAVSTWQGVAGLEKTN